MPTAPTATKTYDSLIRVSKMNGRTVSAESTMTIRDQEGANADAIRTAGGQVGKIVHALDESGATITESPSWRECVERVRRGESHGIVVAYGDRLSRNWRKVGRFYDDLEAVGAEVIISAMPGIDYRTPEGRAQTGMIAVMSDMQYQAAKVRGERIFARVIERGILNRVPYGYLRNANRDGVKADASRDAKALVPDPERAEVVRLIFQLRAKGYGMGAIADELHTRGIASPKGQARWSHTSIGQVVRNRAYVGEVVYGTQQAKRRARREGTQAPEPVVIKGCHEPIVTEAEWRRAQTARRTVVRNGSMAGGFATGMLRCSGCGRNMSAIGAEHGGTYGCRSAAGAGGEPCPCKVFIARPGVDAWLEAQVRDLLFHGTGVAFIASARDLSRLEAERDGARAEVEAYVINVPATTPGYADGLALRNGTLARAEATLVEARAQAADAREWPTTPAAWEALTPEHRNEVARSLIVGVTVRPAATKAKADIAADARCVIEWRHGR